MQSLPKFSDPNLLVGPEHFSDAGVYAVDEQKAIVQTVDFFPPVVDDPFVFGQIAAANSLSDCYAMGARPITALNIVGFPDDKLSTDVLGEILRGGAERVQEAGAVIVGGHSVRDTEIKYGLAVTGMIQRDQIMTNSAAKSGDVLVLTKALGTGFITTAERAGRCPKDVLKAACDSMVTLNRDAASAAVEAGATGATDITGFGLAGHALELAQASGVTLHLSLGKLPLLSGALDCAAQGYLSRANQTNRDFAGPAMAFDGVDERSGAAECLFDPQTSGGLLIAVAAERADALLNRCRDAGLTGAAIVGRVAEKQDRSIIIEP